MFGNSVFPQQQMHIIRLIKTNLFKLCREIITLFSEIHTKHINTLWGQNVELFNVKPGGT